MAIGQPDQLRGPGGTSRVEIIGRGFTPGRVALLRARPEAAAATVEDDHLFVELRAGGDIAPLIGLLVRAGAEIEEVRTGQASLEDVFLSLMQEAA